MLTIDVLESYRNNTWFGNNIEIYNGKYGVGLMYYAYINDYGYTEPRLAIFDSLPDLDDFVQFIKYSDFVVSNTTDLIDNKPLFYLSNKLLTSDDVTELKNRDTLVYNASKELVDYMNNRVSEVFIKYETLRRENELLQNVVKENSKINVLYSKNNTLVDSVHINNEDIDSSRPKDKVISELNFYKSMYTVQLKRNEELKRKLDILWEFYNLGYFKRRKVTQEIIDNKLSNVKTDLISLTESDFFKYSRVLEGIFNIVPKNGDIKDRSIIYNKEKLEAYKKFDSLFSLDELEKFITDISLRSKDFINKAIEEYDTLEVKDYTHNIKDEKMGNFFQSLKEQYDKNLSQEQKNSLTIYNSRFFEIVNFMLCLDNYEDLSNEEILNNMLKSDKVERFMIIIYDHISSFKYGAYDKEAKDLFIKIMPEEVHDDILNYIKDIRFNNGHYSDIDDIYSIRPAGELTVSEANKIREDLKIQVNNKLCMIIGKLREQVKVLNSISNNAVLLPSQITVYRGMNVSGINEITKPSLSPFISTTALANKAFDYAGNNALIVKINLEEKSPVNIIPDKIIINTMSNKRSLVHFSPYDKYGTKEILLNEKFFDEFVITEPLKEVKHYKFEKGEFIEKPSSYMVSGYMKTRINENSLDHSLTSSVR